MPETDAAHKALLGRWRTFFRLKPAAPAKRACHRRAGPA